MPIHIRQPWSISSKPVTTAALPAHGGKSLGNPQRAKERYSGFTPGMPFDEARRLIESRNYLCKPEDVDAKGQLGALGKKVTIIFCQMAKANQDTLDKKSPTLAITLSVFVRPEIVTAVMYSYGPKPDLAGPTGIGPGILSELAAIEKSFHVGTPERCPSDSQIGLFCSRWNLGEEQYLQLDVQECCYVLRLLTPPAVTQKEIDAYKQSQPDKF
jgi:hypothetical protein